MMEEKLESLIRECVRCKEQLDYYGRIGPCYTCELNKNVQELTEKLKEENQ